MPGEYIINAHYYSTRQYGNVNIGETFRKEEDAKVLTVKVELHKVTPYKIMWAGEKIFVSKGQEETFLRFKLDKDGNIVPPFTFEKKRFINPITGMGVMHPINTRNVYDEEDGESSPAGF